jgi:hypothetical protein
LLIVPLVVLVYWVVVCAVAAAGISKASNSRHAARAKAASQLACDCKTLSLFTRSNYREMVD